MIMVMVLTFDDDDGGADDDADDIADDDDHRHWQILQCKQQDLTDKARPRPFSFGAQWDRNCGISQPVVSAFAHLEVGIAPWAEDLQIV